MNELALFAGTGGGILGGKILGWRTICAVELNSFAASILAQRQNDGFLSPFPIWSDITTFDGRPWRGRVDVISGGFPCQDISQAGAGKGIEGTRSGLWSHMARIIDEVRPQYAFIENSPMLVRRGLTRVLGDLAKMGYDAVWGVVGAGHTGAPHIRERIWVLAYTRDDTVLQYGQQPTKPETKLGRHGSHRPMDTDTYSLGKQQPPVSREEVRDWSGNICADVPNPNSLQRLRRDSDVQVGRLRSQKETQDDGYSGGNEWPSESGLGRVAHGVAYRMDKIRALGNGQVPRVVALAWQLLTELTD